LVFRSDSSTLDIRQINRQIDGMIKKPKPYQPKQDESQIALSVVEKAIGEKLVDTHSPVKPSSSRLKSGKAVAKKPSRP
jgi:hypothetical protein